MATKAKTKSRTLLTKLNKLGIHANPEKVYELREALWWAWRQEQDPDASAQLERALKQADELLAMMQAVTPATQAWSASPIPSPTWTDAASRDLSLAAAGALHDALEAKHRRGGKAKPRPRWSLDEVPRTSDIWGPDTAAVERQNKDKAKHQENRELAKLLTRLRT